VLFLSNLTFRQFHPLDPKARSHNFPAEERVNAFLEGMDKPASQAEINPKIGKPPGHNLAQHPPAGPHLLDPTINSFLASNFFQLPFKKGGQLGHGSM
jgi:hypothetical protein